MQANYVQRIRLIFSKGGPARFISHLDLARTLERALNRPKFRLLTRKGSTAARVCKWPPRCR